MMKFTNLKYLQFSSLPLLFSRFLFLDSPIQFLSQLHVYKIIIRMAKYMHAQTHHSTHICTYIVHTLYFNHCIYYIHVHASVMSVDHLSQIAHTYK